MINRDKSISLLTVDEVREEIRDKVLWVGDCGDTCVLSFL